MYVHVPTVWVAYRAFVVTALCSALYLFTKRRALEDRRAEAASTAGGVA